MRNRGFTLIELIIVLALLALFVTTAVPGFRQLLARQRRAAAAMTLLRTLAAARQRAALDDQYVTVCASDDGADCNGSDWSDGWLMFINLDRDSPPSVDPGEPILRRNGPPSRVDLDGNRAAFTFRPRSLRSTNGSLFICPAGADTGEAIIVSYTGRVRVSQTHDGEPVSCG